MPTEEEIHAAAKVIHEHGVAHGWFGEHYKKTFEELLTTDPIGFIEFTDIIRTAFETAEALRAKGKKAKSRTLSRGLTPGSRIDKKV